MQFPLRKQALEAALPAPPVVNNPSVSMSPDAMAAASQSSEDVAKMRMGAMASGPLSAAISADGLRSMPPAPRLDAGPLPTRSLPATAPSAVTAEPLSLAEKLQYAPNAYRGQVADQLLRLGIGAFGVGAAVRGARGLFGTVNEATDDPPAVPLRTEYLDVPVRRKRAEVSGPYAAAAGAIADLLTKRAVETVPPVAPVAPVTPATLPAAPLLPKPGLGDRAVDFFGGMETPGDPNWTGKDWLWNHSAQYPHQMPWAMAAGVPLVLGGAVAGHELMGAVMGKARDNEGDRELAEAKERYETALIPKAASVPDAIDLLYAMVKHANDQIDVQAGAYGLAAVGMGHIKRANSFGDLNTITAAYLLGAGTLGIGAGVAVHNWTRAHAKDKLIADAVKLRQERMFAEGPGSIVVNPVPSGDEPLPRFRLPHKAAGAAGLAGAASATLNRLNADTAKRQQQMAEYFGIAPKAEKPPAAPARPLPPQLPSAVNPPAA